MTLLRSPRNPILTRADIPAVLPDFADVTSVFNPGAIHDGGRTLLMLRVQSRGRRTALVMAESDDGERFTVHGEPVVFRGIERAGEKLHHLYDPRLTRIGDRVYVLFAADTETGCKLGVGSTKDFETFDFIGLGSHPDRQNDADGLAVRHPQQPADAPVHVAQPQHAVQPYAGISQGRDRQEHVFHGRRAVLAVERKALEHWARVGHAGDHRLGRIADRPADQRGDLAKQLRVVHDHKRDDLFVLARRGPNACLNDLLQIPPGDRRISERPAVAVAFGKGVEDVHTFLPGVEAA